MFQQSHTQYQNISKANVLPVLALWLNGCKDVRNIKLHVMDNAALQNIPQKQNH